MDCNGLVIFAVALGLVALGFGVAAWILSGVGTFGLVPASLFAWSALVAGFVAAGYARNDVRVFGKSNDGTRAAWARAFLLPYFGGVALARWIQRTATGEDAWNLVAPDLYVGRYVPTDDLPQDVTFIADLTAELTEPLETRERYGYACVPTLDGTAPDVQQLRALADLLETRTGPIYVHCAAGHGRAAMAASVLLIRRGLADDVYDAQRLMRQTRPKVRMTRVQRDAVTAAA